jgi:hypothetical protein
MNITEPAADRTLRALTAADTEPLTLEPLPEVPGMAEEVEVRELRRQSRGNRRRDRVDRRLEPGMSMFDGIFSREAFARRDILGDARRCATRPARLRRPQ